MRDTNNIYHIRATCFGRDSAIIRPLKNIQGMTSVHSMGSHFVTLEITEYQYEPATWISGDNPLDWTVLVQFLLYFIQLFLHQYS
jgi:hypothetical protein